MPAWNPALWIAQNWTYIVGWGAVLICAQRLYVFVSKIIETRDDLTILKMDLTLIKNNHLPHIQGEIELINTNLDRLQQTVGDGFSGPRDDMRALLVKQQYE